MDMNFDMIAMIESVKESFLEHPGRHPGRLELSVLAYNKFVDDWNNKVRRLGKGKKTLSLISEASEAPKGLVVSEMVLYVVDSKEDWYFSIGASRNLRDSQ